MQAESTSGAHRSRRHSSGGAGAVSLRRIRTAPPPGPGSLEAGRGGPPGFGGGLGGGVRGSSSGGGVGDTVYSVGMSVLGAPGAMVSSVLSRLSRVRGGAGGGRRGKVGGGWPFLKWTVFA